MRERKANSCTCPHKSPVESTQIAINLVVVSDQWCVGSLCACWLWTLDPDTAKEQREHATGRCGLARDSQDMIDDVTTEG